MLACWHFSKDISKYISHTPNPSQNTFKQLNVHIYSIVVVNVVLAIYSKWQSSYIKSHSCFYISNKNINVRIWSRAKPWIWWLGIFGFLLLWLPHLLLFIFFSFVCCYSVFSFVIKSIYLQVSLFNWNIEKYERLKQNHLTLHIMSIYM